MIISQYQLQFTGLDACKLLQCRKYGLEDDTIDFIGHALALHSNDSYLDQQALGFIKRMKVKVSFVSYFHLCSTANG